MRRKGFTLIELMISMVIMLILLYIGLSSFSFINSYARYMQYNQNVLNDMDLVLAQIKKELMQASTKSDGTNFYGIAYPSYNPDQDTVRGIQDLVNPYPLDLNHDYYSFTSSEPILQFYIIDSNGIKHRITYTLGVPTNNGNYNGISKSYWLNKSYEPCEVRYSNETWNGNEWTGIQNQPITEQVITNLIVIRPAYSNKVFQILLESYIKDPFSRSGKRFTRMIQITLKQ
jgi:prepilin-type N-terminal cleavage/methylation domain-containing protein